MKKKILVWFRNDLRLSDNPALCAAAQEAEIIPVFILDDNAAGQWAMGGASRWWLHHSLESLGNNIAKHQSNFILRRGDSETILREILEQTKADGVYWNRRYEPYAIAQDKQIKESLKQDGFEVESFKAALLFEPWEVATQQGNFYKVFTPFWKACRAMGAPKAALEVPTFTANDYAKYSDNLTDWNLLPTRPDWAEGLRDSWQVGEGAAQNRLAEFLEEAVSLYAAKRDFPSVDATSRLSAYLHFGEISPRQIWQATKFAQDSERISTKNADKFLAEVGWREFSYHLMYYFPQLPDSAFRPEYNDFPWSENKDYVTRWQKGQTGYPLVDAGMRELWHTGIMHNRVRMVVASFLIKHLLQPWQVGEQWFWDTLVDADLASNSASWQWVAGCGADAAPYFRIFNPILQSKKFDGKGEYLRKWLPELAHLSDKDIHAPWEMENPPKDYPKPIVDHSHARDRAMDAYKKLKKSAEKAA